MGNLSYQQDGLILKRGGAAIKQQIQDLQADLRSLGYLRNGIDGLFGPGTEKTVMGLQYDLLNNDGRGQDRSSHLKVKDYNKGRVIQVNGIVDQTLVGCISDMLHDNNYPRLPFAADPVAENNKIIKQIEAFSSQDVPIPFLLGILKQETGIKHYFEPGTGDKDNFIVVGLDTNNSKLPYAITSRGYGVGQYTLFHHPARPEEVHEFMLDATQNLQKAIVELRGKYNNFVNGPMDHAADRASEIGNGPLRICKYKASDARYMKDCKKCLLAAGLQDIKQGVTTFYPGCKDTFQPTQYYSNGSYHGVPIRKNIGCDWIYAVRRYNGSGINSFHYQVKIMFHMLALEGI
jgi:hypothetical protein